MPDRVPLDDPRWDGWQSTYGSARRVAHLLNQATAGDPFDRWYHDLFQELCHQETLSEAAYAALPHLVLLAEQAHEHRIELLVLIGACAAAAAAPGAPAIPNGLEVGWRSAMAAALPLVGQALGEAGLSENQVRYLAFSAAALQEYPDLANHFESFNG